MPLSKQKKQQLFAYYNDLLSAYPHAFVIQYSHIDVSTASSIRKKIKQHGCVYKVIKKRIFLKVINQLPLQQIDLHNLPGSVGVVFAHDTNDDFSVLKVFHEATVSLRKDIPDGGFVFLGAWMKGDRKDGSYVSMLATLPSKNTLIAQLMFMCKYPIQSLASVLDQAAKRLST